MALSFQRPVLDYDSAGCSFHQQTRTVNRKNQLSWKEKRGRRDVVELITIDRLTTIQKERERKKEKVSCIATVFLWDLK